MIRVVKQWEGGGKRGLHFWCPGCDAAHSVTVGPDGWTWNGDVIKPVLHPSILLKTGHFCGGVAAERGHCWCNFKERTGRDTKFKCVRCHSFVRDGRIEFLSDSTHTLAGQTVDLPPWPYGDEQ